MKDRIVQYPNRYQLVPVAGQANVYDIQAVPGVVTETGTPVNKGSLLSDTTATLYGGADTVDKALAKIPSGASQKIPVSDKDGNRYHLYVETLEKFSKYAVWSSGIGASNVMNGAITGDYIDVSGVNGVLRMDINTLKSISIYEGVGLSYPAYSDGVYYYIKPNKGIFKYRISDFYPMGSTSFDWDSGFAFDGNFFYCTEGYTDRKNFYKVDKNSLSVVQSVVIGSNNGVVSMQDESYIFAHHKGNIQKILASNLALVSTTYIGDERGNTCYCSDSVCLYVHMGIEKQLIKIRKSDMVVEIRLPFDAYTENMTISENYLIVGTRGFIAIYDKNNMALIKKIPIHNGGTFINNQSTLIYNDNFEANSPGIFKINLRPNTYLVNRLERL